MIRARVRWSGPLGVWLATLRVDAHGMHRDLQATGLTAASAIINLAELHRRHAEPKQQAQRARRHPAEGAEAEQRDPGCDPAETVIDYGLNVYACPCGCGWQSIVDIGSNTHWWERTGYAYDWHRKTASSAHDQASAISARSEPGRTDDQARAYFVGPDYFTVHHNGDGMRVYSWAETDTEIEAPEDQAPGRPPPCS